MKILTKDLIGPALDWAVAKANGTDPETLWAEIGIGEPAAYQMTYPEYSACWSHAGPIIEREKVELHWDDGTWYAKHPSIRPRSKSWRTGPTALVAAMRVFVAYKVGNEVDIPEELIR